MTLTVTNQPGQTVTDVHVYLPGTDADPADPFSPPFLTLLRPFRALRFMGWLGTNGSTVAAWADRPSADAFGAGATYERIAALLNETGKDTWINVPEHATDDSSTGALGTLFAAADANIDQMEATFAQFAQLVQHSGIAMTAYEGGQASRG